MKAIRLPFLRITEFRTRGAFYLWLAIGCLLPAFGALAQGKLAPYAGAIPPQSCESQASAASGSDDRKFESLHANDTKTSPLLAKLLINIAPYGDIFIDGQCRARDASRETLTLPVGVYDLEVRNAWSTPFARRIVISAAGRSVQVRLQPLPAQLVVLTNVDAEVLVDGRAVGRSWTSELAPLSVKLNQWRAKRKVTIVIRRRGYRTHRTTATVVAGTRTVVEAKLRLHLSPRAKPALPRTAHMLK